MSADARRSPFGNVEGWSLKAVIVKSHDDLRQEVFAMQLIDLVHDIWAAAGKPLYIRPYRVMSTSADTGIVECITDATSIDALKKSRGYTNMVNHFEKVAVAALSTHDTLADIWAAELREIPHGRSALRVVACWVLVADVHPERERPVSV